MAKVIKVFNEEAMKNFAEETARQIGPGDILLLKGDLGAGKTTFTKYLAGSLGVKEVVTSPTFTVIAEYAVKGHGIIKEFVHADLYRCKEGDRIMLHSLQEMWETAANSARVVVIEWPERLGDNIPQAAKRLEFLFEEKEGSRIVKVYR